MNSLYGDLKLTLRQWARSPVFATVCIATLALGLGANTAVFSVLYSAVINVLPYPHSEQLVAIQTHTGRANSGVFSYPDFQGMQQQLRSVRTAAWVSGAANIQIGAEPAHVVAPRVSAGFFDLLQKAPVMGHFFEPGDDHEGAAPVVVLSEELWRQRFGADASLIGRALNINGEAYTVIGVAPRTIQLPQTCDQCVWLPLRPLRTRLFTDPDTEFFPVLGRLQPGFTRDRAAAEVSTVLDRLHRARADNNAGPVNASVIPLSVIVSNGYRTELYLIFAAVLLVLLIACLNVANLFLAKGLARQGEVSIRVALGAPRSRILRQALTESFLMAVLGAFLAVVVASCILNVAHRFGAAYLPALSSSRINGWMLLFVVGVAACTSLFFGMIAAAMTMQPGAQPALSSKRAGTSRRQHQVRGALVAGEAALALVLLVSTGLLVRTLYALEHKDLGLTTDGVLTGRITLSPFQYHDRNVVTAWYDPFLQKLRQAPNVTAAGVGSFLPLQRSHVSATFKLAGDEKERLPAQIRLISPGYLSALGVPVLRGRDFADTDRPNTPLVALINERLAVRDFGSQDPVGQQLFFEIGEDRIPYTIVGVERSYQQQEPQSDSQPEIAIDVLQIAPHTLFYDLAALQIVGVVRSSSPATSIQSLIVKAAQEVDSTQQISVAPLRQILANSLTSQTIALVLFAAFGLLAILLACAGIYSTLTWMVTQRTQEIGVRMALGSTRAGILKLVLGRVLIWTGMGALAGVVGSIIAGQLLHSLLWGVGTLDPLALMGALILLFGVAGLASVVPAIRAANLNPVQALRE